MKRSSLIFMTLLVDGVSCRWKKVTRDGEVVRTSRYLGSETVTVSDGDLDPPSGYRRNELARGRR